MHVFRLVNGGQVDRIIAFDSLPKRLLYGIRTKPMDGFPKYWHKWLIENGSVRETLIFNPETGIREPHQEPCTFILDYKIVNQDIQKWQEIANYVRKAVDLSVRLLDKIDDMAKPFAKDSVSELSLEPEDVPVVPVPSEIKTEDKKPVVMRPVRSEEEKAPVMAEEVAVPVVKKKIGRPRKQLVA